MHAIVPTPEAVQHVQAGDEHSAAVTVIGDLYMWGRGDSGQLGLGDVRAKWKPTLVKELVVVHPGKFAFQLSSPRSASRHARGCIEACTSVVH